MTEDVKSRNIQPDPFLKEFMAEPKVPAEVGYLNETINFEEFSTIRSLAAIPNKQLKLMLEMLDVDRSGFVKAEELDELINLCEPFTDTKCSIADFISRSEKYRNLISKDGKISISEVHELLGKFREAIIKMEFDEYDNKCIGSISSQDFAMSFVSFAHHKQVHKLICKVKSCPDYGRVTLDEFLEFDEAILNSDDIIQCIQPLSKITSQQKTSKVIRQAFFVVAGRLVPFHIINILIHVTRDDDGVVDLEKFFLLVKERQTINLTKRSMHREHYNHTGVLNLHTY